MPKKTQPVEPVETSPAETVPVTLQPKHAPGFLIFRAAAGITSFSTAKGTYEVEENGLVWLPSVTSADIELIDRMLGVSIFLP
jgi:hypothetical protein